MGLWRVEEAARYLGIRPKTLYDWVRRGRVPHRKLGFNVRFDPEELERWVREQAARRPAGAGEAVQALRAAALEAAERLRRLEADLGAQLSFPERQGLRRLAERLRAAAQGVAGE